MASLPKPPQSQSQSQSTLPAATVEQPRMAQAADAASAGVRFDVASLSVPLSPLSPSSPTAAVPDNQQPARPSTSTPNRFQLRMLSRKELDQYFESLPLDYSWLYKSRRPLAVRIRGSVIKATLIQMLLVTAVAVLVTSLTMKKVVKLSIEQTPTSILTSIVSLLVAFFCNSNYARYYEARRVWGGITTHIRNSVRLLWANVKEHGGSSEQSQAAKKAACRSLVAYAVAVRLHLKQPEPLSEIKDVQIVNQLMKHVPGFAAHTGNGHLAGRAALDLDNNDDDSGLTLDDQIIRSNVGLAARARASGDAAEKGYNFAAECPNPEILAAAKAKAANGGGGGGEKPKVSRHATWSHYGTSSEKIQAVAASHLMHSHFTSFWKRLLFHPRLHPGMLSAFNLRARYLRHNHVPVPITILNHYGSYLTYVQTNNLAPPGVQNALQASLNSMMDSVTALERILHTPVPLGYVIFLYQVVWVYLLLLPFQWVKQLEWVTIPVCMFASFALFGVINIGRELENPFDGDDNDLRHGEFVADMWKECETYAYDGAAIPDYTVWAVPPSRSATLAASTPAKTD